MFFEQPLPLETKIEVITSRALSNKMNVNISTIFFSFSRLPGSFSNADRFYHKKVCWWRKSQTALFTSLYRFKTASCHLCIPTNTVVVLLSLGLGNQIYSHRYLLLPRLCLFTLGQNKKVTLNSFASNAPFSLPPENIRKPYGFRIFSGVRESVQWKRMD